MVCEHRSYSASKKWFTANRLWPRYLLCSTADLAEIIYLVIYMASIRVMSEHSWTRWVYLYRAPEECMLLALLHRQGTEEFKRQKGFPGETDVICQNPAPHQGLLGLRCHAQGEAMGRPITTPLKLIWAMGSKLVWALQKGKRKKEKIRESHNNCSIIWKNVNCSNWGTCHPVHWEGRSNCFLHSFISFS